MKNSFILLIGCIFCLVSACGNDSPTVGEDQALSGMPNSESAIFTIVQDLELTKDTMIRKGPVNIMRDSISIDVTAFVRDNQPVMIHGKYAQSDQWYYLKERRVIMLKEYQYLNQGGASIIENQFFYTTDTLLSARTRQAPNQDSLVQLSFEPYVSPYGPKDFRLNATEVNVSATNFIYGR